MAQRTYDGTLQFNKSFSEADAAKRGKNPNISPTVTCTDVKTSTVFDDHEKTNDLNIKYEVVDEATTPEPEKPEEPVEPVEPSEP